MMWHCKLGAHPITHLYQALWQRRTRWNAVMTSHNLMLRPYLQWQCVHNNYYYATVLTDNKYGTSVPLGRTRV